MRDYIVFAVFLGGLPVFFINPFVGVMAFHVVSIMNLQRYTWGNAHDFPFAMLIAGASIGGLIIRKSELKLLVGEIETKLMLVLWGIVAVSTLLSLDPTVSKNELLRFSKILLMTFLTLALCGSQYRLRCMLWVVAVSMGVLGLKGALSGVLAGGSNILYGPEGSFIADNNDFGLALNMAIPIIFQLACEEKTRLFKILMWLLFFGTIIATLLTFSRAAVVTLVIVLVVMLAKTKMKMIFAIAIVGTMLFASSILDMGKFENRMSSISRASTDDSFMGRVTSWHTAWNIAIEYPLTGGGLGVTDSVKIYERYSPKPDDFRASHSIYFQVLGENGFPGLFVFLWLFIGLMLSLRKTRRECSIQPTLQWVDNYGKGLQLSIFAYLINGSTLGRAYFDLAFLVVALGIALKSLARVPSAGLMKLEMPSVSS